MSGNVDKDIYGGNKSHPPTLIVSLGMSPSCCNSTLLWTLLVIFKVTQGFIQEFMEGGTVTQCCTLKTLGSLGGSGFSEGIVKPFLFIADTAT